MGKRSVSIVRTGPTGPRTLAGKARSKFNALKHGILSNAVVLKTESAAEYARFVSELFDVWQPVGRHEETLVELIAATFWRRSRLLEAEAAAIGLTELLAHRTWGQKIRDGWWAQIGYEGEGAIRKTLLTDDTEGMFRVIERMKDLKGRILNRGLDWNRDLPELERLFGKGDLPKEGTEESASAVSHESLPPLPVLYQRVLHQEVDPGHKDGGHDKAVFIGEELDSHMHFLERRARESEERDSQLEAFRASRNLVPKKKDCELLMRYEAHLDRVLDRALSQLERLQRMRLGQPVLPPVRVELSK